MTAQTVSRFRGRLAATAVMLIVGACASPGVPPGGPERHTPPMITRIEPDTNAVNVRGSEFVMHFDEVISERPTSAASIGDLVLISPRVGAPVVDWHRTSISLHPRKGWRANTAYTVTLLPGLTDLRGNVRKTSTVVTFSTGASIPNTRVHGILFDWLAGTPVTTGLVELYPAADSSLAYIATTDSLGAFALRGLPAGNYRVRGFVDQNHNRGLDPGEAFDTTHVTVADSVSVELYAFAHDSLGPKLSGVTAQDSVTLHATFDTPVDPRVPLDVAHFSLAGPDSVRIALRSVALPHADTTHAAPVVPAVPPPTPSAVPIPQPRAAPPRVLPKPNRPLLTRDVTVIVATPLRRGVTYRLRAIDATGPTGRTLTSDRTFTVPAAPTTDSLHAAPTRPTPTSGATPRRPRP